MKLINLLKAQQKVAIAFSGGVDSSYLLYAAVQSGVTVCAYYVKSAFQPQFELEDAVRLTKQLCAELRVIPLEALESEAVASNPGDRCYHCKKLIFGAIAKAAAKDGFSVLLDGTNASDDEGDRPGMLALRELQVRSPLRECGLAKPEIRRLSKEAGLFTWNKPAYACLATRIPTGESITLEKLVMTEAAEDFLFSLGFTDFRVRMTGTAARLQFPEAQLNKVLECRTRIVSELKRDYTDVYLDLEVRA